MKKKFMLLMTAFITLALTGCGASDSRPAASGSISERADQMMDTIPESVKGKKILVAYYSWSGHTRSVAQQIQQETGGDIFEIQPAKAYPKDYQECVDIAKKEVNDNVRPAVASKVENMGQYDVIFVGYPIWWGKAPMFVYTFLESYDLKGKVVIPFCTSGGSPIDGSIPDIWQSAAGAQLVKGSQDTDAAKITQWLKTIQVMQ